MNDWDSHDWVGVIAGLILVACFVLAYVGII